MNVKKLKKLKAKHKKIMNTISSYAWLAREWPITEEDDYEDLSDAVMDALLKGK